MQQKIKLLQDFIATHGSILKFAEAKLEGNSVQPAGLGQKVFLELNAARGVLARAPGEGGGYPDYITLDSLAEVTATEFSIAVTHKFQGMEITRVYEATKPAGAVDEPEPIPVPEVTTKAEAKKGKK